MSGERLGFIVTKELLEELFDAQQYKKTVASSVKAREDEIAALIKSGAVVEPSEYLFDQETGEVRISADAQEAGL